MVINRIITEKELNYIETLYLYANLEDFIDYKSNALDWLVGERNQKTYKLITKKDILKEYASEKYSMMLEYVYDTLLHSAKFLGSSKARDWYELENYRIGIMPFDTAKKSNQFNVEIQYKQSHMFSLGEKLKGLDLPFDDELSKYHIRRIDVSQIVKTPNDYLTNHNYISPYRTMARFDKNGITETVYLGNRKSGNVFRMYNKTIELQTDTKDHPINYNKIELFSRYFGDIENLYTFELELHRKYIKPAFGIETLADLEKVYKAHKEIVGKIKIYEDNDYNKKLIKSKNYKRIKNLLCFTEYEEFKRIQKKEYKSSESYMIDKIVSGFERYESSLEEPLKEHSKLLILDKIMSRMFGDKDISIELDDAEYMSDYFELKGQIEMMRDNQDDSLFKEANLAFAPIMLQVPRQN